MTHSWTPPQREAFEAEKGDLLICAAAGSGKTTVLTQRVIRSLTREHPIDINRMLIVTFTRASAAELKAKISRAITEKMGQEQGSPRLQRQLLLLDQAQISTIDSFCLNLISGYFTELNLPAAIRVGDEAEMELLQMQVMENLLNQLYEEQSPEFLRLARCFTVLRDNQLSTLLLKIYRKVQSYPEGVDFVLHSAQKLQESAQSGLYDSDFGRQLDSGLCKLLTHYKRAYTLLIDGLPGSDPEKAVDKFRQDLSEMDRMLSCPDPGSRAKLLQNLEFPTLDRVSNKSDAYVRLQNLRDEYKKRIREMRDEAFSGSESDHRIASDRSAQICMTLYRLLLRFDGIYDSEKKRLGRMDYIDVERSAHRLLLSDGKPTDIAHRIAARFDQIYIDEYQDVNRLQDDIFRAISRENRFMVGDIKQSIYAFRGAVPDLFAGYRRAFPDYDSGNPGKSGKIFLSHNFRSDGPILGFSNALFDRLFGWGSGKVPYTADDALRLPDGKDAGGKPVRLCLIEGKKGDGDPEAVYVADRIAEQIANGWHPGEIAILFRSPKRVSKIFEEELRRRGIPTESSVEENFLDSPEILLMMALLGAIDNPRRDVHLAGAMISPIFAFTLEELILVQKDYPAQCLYESLLLAENTGNFPKISDFLTRLNRLRDQARLCPADRLIREIYRQTALPALVGGDPECGREGVDRLRRFYAFAHTFEKTSFRGLHSFFGYLCDAKDGKLTPKIEKPANHRDCVKILSVHQSKGLEFPVVYLCRADSEMNTKDLTGNLLLERDLGITFRLRDENDYTNYEPMMYRAVASRIRENLIDEEMRILYVALTRPMQELTVTACLPDLSQADRMLDNSDLADGYSVSRNPCYLAWILYALGKEQGDRSVYEIERIRQTDAEQFDTESQPDGRANPVLANSEDEPEIDPATLAQRLGYVYPHQAEVSIPSKAVVSALYPGYLDESDELPVRSRFHEKPAFLEPYRKPTGAERGTATHLFMQFCDFDRVRRYGVEAELARLVDRGFLDQSRANLVRTDRLARFFASPLFGQMSESPELHREYRFLLSRPAGEFTENPRLAAEIPESRLLVQGVIDCFFLLPDGSYKLVDYKTDRIYPENDPDAAISNLISEYSDQLRYYRDAIQQLGGKKVSETVIFSFDLGREIPILK